MFIKLAMVVLMISSSGLLLEQKNTRPQARLVRTFYKGDFIHAAGDAAIALIAFANKPGDKIAVRVCSKEPIPLALAIASGRPFYLASLLVENYNYAPENILFQRSDECSDNPLLATTEFWAIPKGAPLPCALETIKSSEVSAEEYWPQQGIDRLGISFEQLLNKQIEQLRAEETAIAVVIGYYLKKPSPRLKMNLAKAGRAIAKSGLTKKKYFIRSLPWTGMIDTTDREPVFPTIIIIKMRGETASSLSSIELKCMP